MKGLDLGLGVVAHGFVVVTVGPDDEGTVVVRVVLRSDSRWAIVFAARGKCRNVKRSDLAPILSGKRYVDGPWRATERAEPELTLSVFSDHCPAFALRCDADSEGGQRLHQEGLALFQIAHVETDVVKDHGHLQFEFGIDYSGALSSEA
jgi:hypothetical protein